MRNLRVRFKDLTDTEKEIVCNGCGPKGIPVPIPQFRFRASCDHHDFNYWLGCNRLQRKKADLQFLREMMIDAGNSYWHKRWALSYYRAVRTWGVFCFHWAKEQRNRIDLDKTVEEYLKTTNDPSNLPDV